MAKTTAGEMPKMEPTAHISWPAEGIKLSGDWKAIGLGKKVRIVLEGPVKGFSMKDYGCDLDLKPKVIRVEAVGDGDSDDDGPSLADMVGKAGTRPKKG